MHLMEITSNSSLTGRKSEVSLLNKASPWCFFEENGHVNVRRKYLFYIVSPRSAFPFILPFRAFIAFFLTLFSCTFQFSPFAYRFLSTSYYLIYVRRICLLLPSYFRYLYVLTYVRTVWESSGVEVQVDLNHSF